MLQKINQVHGASGVYIPPKNTYESQFGIQHFAGIVHYDSKGTIVINSEPLLAGSAALFLLCVWSLYLRLSGEEP